MNIPKFFHISWIVLLLVTSWSCGMEQPDDPVLADFTQIRINIASSQMTLIKRKRAEALALGLLHSSSDDFVDATIKIDSLEQAAKIRLKGDWLDHLKGDKWSWRVKLAEGDPTLGLEQFSLQAPNTRSFLDEWIFHQLMEAEDILTPRYTFVQLWLNGRYKGIYALEEHFIATLPERQARRAAPILKFTEDGFWQTQAYRIQYGENITPYLPVYEAADIMPFQKGKTTKSPVLYTQFQAARERLDNYRQDPASAPGLLTNEDKLARLYALVDITEAYHGLRWHNMRFYYNPTTSLLEPIAYDAYSATGVYRWFKKPFLGYWDDKKEKVYFMEEQLIFAPFNSPDFRKTYYDYLDRYTEPAYLDNFFQQLSPTLQTLEHALQLEFPDYKYRPQDVQNRVQVLRQAVADYQATQASATVAPRFSYTIHDPMYEDCKSPIPMADVTLKAYPAVDSSHLWLQNYYCQPITIQASGPKRNKPTHVLDQPLTLTLFDIHQQPPTAYPLAWPPGDRYVFYSVPGIDYWYRREISHWLTPKKTNFFGPQDMQLDSTVFRFRGQELVVLAGEYTVRETQIIPRYLSLTIEAGARIDLVDGAAIFAFGEVNMQGSKQQVIRIHSSDNSGRGVHFMESPRPIQLQYVRFEQLDTYADRGRFLNGAVSVYESNISIQNCTFTGGRAEDALNIVRSPAAHLEGLTFQDCQGDGLDVDFSRGSISNSRFEQIGGDALDFSGSDFELRQLQLTAIADKGISAGEASHLRGGDIKCQQLSIGIAAKDGSQVVLENVQLQQCRYALVAFAKKAIYPAASLMTAYFQLDSTACFFPYATEPGQLLRVNGDTIKATHEKGELKGLFYE